MFEENVKANLPKPSIEIKNVLISNKGWLTHKDKMQFQAQSMIPSLNLGMLSIKRTSSTKDKTLPSNMHKFNNSKHSNADKFRFMLNNSLKYSDVQIKDAPWDFGNIEDVLPKVWNLSMQSNTNTSKFERRKDADTSLLKSLQKKSAIKKRIRAMSSVELLRLLLPLPADCNIELQQ